MWRTPTAVTWVESHDNYCNDGTAVSLTEDQVIQGWAVVCARGSGTPLFFDRPYGASASNMWGSMNRIGAAGSPFFRDERVAAVNRFRNAMVGESERLFNADEEETVLLIGRGERGLVLVNAGRYSYNLHTPVDLADGTYTDRAGSGMTYTVSGGVLTGSVLAGGVAVLYEDGYLEIPDLPETGLETESFILSGGAAEAVLRLEGAESGSYSVDGGEAVPFQDGDRVTVESGEEGAVTITLRAKGEGGETVRSWVFTVQGPRNVDAGTVIRFQRPEDWGETIYAYVYDESTGAVKEAAPWPGAACTPEADGTWSYTFPESWENVLVIFTDGKNQVPGAMEPGMVVEPDKVYTAG